MNVFAKIVAWFKKLLAGTRQLFFVVWTASKKEIADALNDPELQQMALTAVRNAALAKLRGEDAWKEAFSEFNSAVIGAGHDIATSILEAILQNTYVVFKFNGGLNGVQD